MAERYLTKFALLTLAEGKEPLAWMKNKVDWPSGKIEMHLKAIALKHGLEMVARVTIRQWINKAKENGN